MTTTSDTKLKATVDGSRETGRRPGQDPRRYVVRTSSWLTEQSHDGAKADVVTELFDFADVNGFEFGVVILWQSNGKLRKFVCVL